MERRGGVLGRRRGDQVRRGGGKSIVGGAAARTPWRQRPVARLVERAAKPAAAHALRAAGGARLPGSAAGDQTLDLLRRSPAMRRHMLDQRGGAAATTATTDAATSRGEGGRLVITEEREYAGSANARTTTMTVEASARGRTFLAAAARARERDAFGQDGGTTKTRGRRGAGRPRAGRTVTARTCTARRRAPEETRRVRIASWSRTRTGSSIPNCSTAARAKCGGEGMRVGEVVRAGQVGDSPRAKGEGFRVTRGRDGRRRGVAECDSFERFRRVSSVRSRRRLSSSAPGGGRSFFTQ